MNLPNDQIIIQKKGQWEDVADEYYNVTTDQVLHRLQLAIAVDGSFLEGLVGTTNKSDFYGPIWIGATSALSIFVGSHLSQFLSTGRISPSYHNLLSALLTIYGYMFLEGAGVWLVCKYGFNAGNMEVGPGMLVTLVGYALALLVPAALLGAMPAWWFQGMVMGTAAVLSCLFVYRNAGAVLARQEGMRSEQVGVLMAVWMACHASLFALVMVRYY